MLSASLLISLAVVGGAQAEGVHLPLIRKETLVRRGQSSAIGLGDYADVTYNVLLKVGSVETPVVLDTGSSDLWVIADNCIDCNTTLPLYPHDTFKSTGLPAQLLYGDSKTGTHAIGEIGTDSLALAGLSSPTQYFAAITDTNTSVTDSGGTGIFGLGFPINSFIWSQTFKASQNISTNTNAKREAAPEARRPQFPDLKSLYGRDGTNLKRPQFPRLSELYPRTPSIGRRQGSSSAQFTDLILSSWEKTGPFLTRLAQSSFTTLPMFAITLQRDAFDIGGNAGQLSIGSLPEGVKNESLTWVPLRAYTEAQGGLTPPSSSPSEVYPLTWEVFLDDVYLDGQKLPRSKLASPSIKLSALVDTGNSLLRGPPDLVNTIYQTLGADSQGVFPCSKPHTLAFSIGGKIFPVDPRDFATQAYQDDVSRCTANLVDTDTPVEGEGYLFQWSLGDPFLKSVLSAYYFGNVTYPSRDEPKMGFLSTVPENADDLYTEAVKAASDSGEKNFPFTSESAPSGTPTAAATDSNGLAQASGGADSPSSTGKGKGGGVSALRVKKEAVWVGVLGALVGFVLVV